MLTRSEVRLLLDAHGLAPRKSAGQNFVVEPNTVRKIVRDADVTDRDVVLEVGPGLGSLTLALAASAAEVIAIEVDAGFVRVLHEVLAGCANVEVVHGDVLAVDLAAALGGRSARLVANLPYNIATPAVFRLLEADVISDGYVMVQREVGERWAASVGDPLYGAVSAKLSLLADVTVVERVPRTVFYPQPHVDSVMVRLAPVTRLAPPRWEQVRRLIDAAFAQRRKTLRNNLVGAVEPTRLDVALQRVGLHPSVRAERVSARRFVALQDTLDAESAARDHRMAPTNQGPAPERHPPS